MARPGSMTRPDTRQAEKDYLARTGSSEWERTKPFSPPSSDTLEESAHLLHDFSAAMLMLRPSPDDLILDLGAGAGWCSDLLGRLNRTSIAVDLSLDMLRAGRGRPGQQKRAVAGHHLDFKWRPSDIEQRNGRIERQGNLFAKAMRDNKVPIHYYATKGTLDSTMYDIVSKKGKFIQVFHHFPLVLVFLCHTNEYRFFFSLNLLPDVNQMLVAFREKIE